MINPNETPQALYSRLPNVLLVKFLSFGCEKINDGFVLNDEFIASKAPGLTFSTKGGWTLAAAWGHVTRCPSANMAEAIACIEVLTLGLNYSPRPLLNKTDCSSVVKAFQPEPNGWSTLGHIAKEFFHKIPDGRIAKVCKVSRDTNMTAHNLAQLRRRELCGGVLHRLVPACVLDSILRDCNDDIT